MKENYTHLLHVSLRKIEHPLSPPRNVNEWARTRLPELCIQIISLSSETYHHHTTSNQITSNIPQRSSKNQFPIRFQPLGFAIRTKVQPSNPKPQTPLLRPLLLQIHLITKTTPNRSTPPKRGVSKSETETQKPILLLWKWPLGLEHFLSRFSVGCVLLLLLPSSSITLTEVS